jgi:hypothetical protein
MCRHQEVRDSQAFLDDGHGWARTSDLSRVKAGGREQAERWAVGGRGLSVFGDGCSARASLKGCGAFCAGAADGAGGPAGQERADEPLGFAVGRGAVGAGAEMADPKGAAGDGVDR